MQHQSQRGDTRRHSSARRSTTGRLIATGAATALLACLLGAGVGVGHDPGVAQTGSDLVSQHPRWP